MELLQLEKLGTYEDELINLLCDCVDTGASVGFLPPMSELEARFYWTSVQEAVDANASLILIAKEENVLLGSVQLSFSSKTNAQHRCEVEKLMVLSTARGTGVATMLLQGVENVAASWHKQLITLDTRTDDAAYHLYQKMGYIEAGVVPNFVKSASGNLENTSIFYKEITPSQELI
ncbi:GNAT family N-acetyltransferase [Marinomonas sp. 42_23_T18]|nr:GNAT family N-acetyltransferase [Marinomonas sp. 42_23_T18]